METDLFYKPSGGTTVYLNLARDLSRVNSKNEEVTTRDGHVYGYMVDFKLTGLGATAMTILTAPNSWKMRNAFRKFHAYRDIMFDNAGIEGDELGRYGKTMRPLLDIGQNPDGSSDLVPFTENSDLTTYPSGWDIDGGEWTYTKLATTPIYNADKPIVAEEKWADEFDLHICEENQVQGASAESSGYYKSVGMIHSYNIDRMEVLTPNFIEVVDGPSNPLAALISSGNQATGEVLEIAIDQELETPPYDQVDAGDSIQTLVKGFAASTAEVPNLRMTAFLPAGLARLKFGANNSLLEVKVLGKVLCKDMA
jgi:hypothetical protein